MSVAMDKVSLESKINSIKSQDDILSCIKECISLGLLQSFQQKIIDSVKTATMTTEACDSLVDYLSRIPIEYTVYTTFANTMLDVLVANIDPAKQILRTMKPKTLYYLSGIDQEIFYKSRYAKTCTDKQLLELFRIVSGCPTVGYSQIVEPNKDKIITIVRSIHDKTFNSDALNFMRPNDDAYDDEIDDYDNLCDYVTAFQSHFGSKTLSELNSHWNLIQYGQSIETEIWMFASRVSKDKSVYARAAIYDVFSIAKMYCTETIDSPNNINRVLLETTDMLPNVLSILRNIIVPVYYDKVGEFISKLLYKYHSSIYDENILSKFIAVLDGYMLNGATSEIFKKSYNQEHNIDDFICTECYTFDSTYVALEAEDFNIPEPEAPPEEPEKNHGKSAKTNPEYDVKIKQQSRKRGGVMSAVGRSTYKTFKSFQYGKNKINAKMRDLVSAMRDGLGSSREREIMRGTRRTKIGTPMAILKRALASYGLFCINPLIGIINFVVASANDSKKTKEAKDRILADFNTEIELIKVKLEDARMAGDNQSYYHMFRAKAELEKARNRIKYGTAASERDMENAQNIRRAGYNNSTAFSRM